MNLIKWLRKNSKKVMAVAVVIIMVGFIGGGTILQHLASRRSEQNQPYAFFADNKKITYAQLNAARQQLEILKMLQAENILRSSDLRSALLGELLFSESRNAAPFVNQLIQVINKRGFDISRQQLYDIYNHQHPNSLYWILLTEEAKNAGINIPNEQAGEILGRIVPQLYEGASYSFVIGQVVNRYQVPEEDILSAFAKLLSVLEYSKAICETQDITISQLAKDISREMETFDVNLIQVDSTLFADSQPEPAQQQIDNHFQKYKMYPPQSVDQNNPYGFGYKLPDRVQLEYIAVKLDELSNIIEEPKSDEVEQYYQSNIDKFKKTVPSDPNDPNSTPAEKIIGYAQVSEQISQQLLQNKISSKAEEIIQLAKKINETNLEKANIEKEKLTDETFKKFAADYNDAVQRLKDEYKIEIHTGKTGLLSAMDIVADPNLGTLFVGSKAYNPAGLAQVVFAVDRINTSTLSPFQVPKPHMYENIGPVKDFAGNIMALVRIIDAQKAQEPPSVDYTYSIAGFDLAETREDNSRVNIYSVKEKIVKNLKKLAAMDATKTKADELVKLAKEEGWSNAVEQFNKRFIPATETDSKEPNTFQIKPFKNMTRLSDADTEAVAIRSFGNPNVYFLLSEQKIEKTFRDKLYSLVPNDSNTAASLPLIIEFKPYLSYYVIKDISVERLDQSQYEAAKAMQAYQKELIQAQSLSAAFFNPDNIEKRTNFKLAETPRKIIHQDLPQDEADDL